MDERRIYWHEAHFEAMKLELHQYRNSLSFHNEHLLSKEALEIDILIIKKEPEVVIKKNIGRIFRTHNIVEYKSQTDYLSIRDYNKVLAYALLYSSFGKIPLSQITVTFSLTKRPVKLLNYLVNERNLKLDAVETGITYVAGDILPVQILETKILPENENLFLKSLRRGNDVRTMIKTLGKLDRLIGPSKNNVYADRLVKANQNAYREALRMSKGLKEIHVWIANETDILAERDAARDAERDAERDAKEAKIIKNLLKNGVSAETIALSWDAPLDKILAST